MDLRDKDILITGGSSGIGLEVAKRLVAKGGKVHSFDRQAPLQHVLMNSYPVDIRSTEQIEQALERIEGEIHLLFSNAGILRRGTLLDVSAQDFQDMITVNVLGSREVLRAALEKNKLAPDATILQTCSVVGITPAPKLGAYSLTKQMLHSYIRGIRRDLPHLRIKGLYPGAVKTPMTMAGFASEAEYDKQALENWGVVSTPDEIATLVMQFLDAEEDSLIWNGENRIYEMKNIGI